MPFQYEQFVQHPKPTRIVSFDFDGCLFNKRYIWHWDDKSDENTNQVIKANQIFLNKLKEENTSFDQTILMVGSARQSEALDALNSASLKKPKLATESCFSAIRKIGQYLAQTQSATATPVMLDKFLLNDAFSNVPDGTTFDQAMARMDETHSTFTERYSKKQYNTDLIVDNSKLTILYAQMHKQAKAHPYANIQFDFYDDKGAINSSNEKELLDHLHDYFSQYPNMIPSNMILQLNHYEGSAVTAYQPIKGSGLIDLYYRSTIKEMVNISPKILPNQPLVCAVQHAQPEKLISMNARNHAITQHGCMRFFNPNKPSLGDYIDSRSQTMHDTVQSTVLSPVL